MMVRTQAEDVCWFVRTAMRLAKRLNMVRFCVASSVLQNERFSSDLTFKVVQRLNRARFCGVAQKSISHRLDPRRWSAIVID